MSYLVFIVFFCNSDDVMAVSEEMELNAEGVVSSLSLLPNGTSGTLMKPLASSLIPTGAAVSFCLGKAIDYLISSSSSWSSSFKPYVYISCVTFKYRSSGATLLPFSISLNVFAYLFIYSFSGSSYTGRFFPTFRKKAYLSASKTSISPSPKST